jgi:hypothetical protein
VPDREDVSRRRLAALGILALGCCLGVPALQAARAQEAAVSHSEAADTPSDAERRPLEEIIVRGRPLAEFRAEAERALINIFSTFNDLNSTDDFDIHCVSEVRLGSRIPKRMCKPNYMWDSEEEYARAQFDPAILPGTAIGRAHLKGVTMKGEMRRLAEENTDFQRAMLEYIRAEEAYREARSERHRNSGP